MKKLLKKRRAQNSLVGQAQPTPHSLVLDSFFVAVRLLPHEAQSELGLMKSLLSLKTGHKHRYRERDAIG